MSLRLDCNSPPAWHPLLLQETVLPDEKLVTEGVETLALEDDAVLYLVYRKSGDTFEPISIEDTTLPGEG